MLGHLSARDQLRLTSTLRKVDRLALLLNREYLVVPGLQRQWRPTMRCLWYVATYQEEAGLRILARDNPSSAPDDPKELEKLVRSSAQRQLRRRWPQLRKTTGGEGNPNDCTRARVYTPR